MPDNSTNVNESVTEPSQGDNFDPYPAPSETPMGHIEEVIINDYIERNESKERNDLENDSYFPDYEGFAVIDGYDEIKKMLEDEKKKIEEYNAKLSENKIPYSIRNKHVVKVGNTIYLYNGMYIYKKEVIKNPPLYIPEDDNLEFNCPLCNVVVTPSNKKRHIATKTHKNKLITYNKAEQKLLYIGKFNYGDWRNLLGEEKWKEVRAPPKATVSSLRFKQIYKDQEPTSTIVVPSDIMIQEEFRKLISKCPILKLG